MSLDYTVQWTRHMDRDTTTTLKQFVSSSPSFFLNPSHHHRPWARRTEMKGNKCMPDHRFGHLEDMRRSIQGTPEYTDSWPDDNTSVPVMMKAYVPNVGRGKRLVEDLSEKEDKPSKIWGFWEAQFEEPWLHPRDRWSTFVGRQDPNVARSRLSTKLEQGEDHMA